MLKQIHDLDLDGAPPHPGEILRDDLLPRLSLNPAGLARRLGMPVANLREILSERRPVTGEIATKLAARLGHSTQFWLGLQSQYDRWSAQIALQTA